MNKKLVLSSAVASVLLMATAMPVMAASTNGLANRSDKAQNNINRSSVMSACVKTAVQKRNTALKAAQTTFATDTKAASLTRKAASDAARTAFQTAGASAKTTRNAAITAAKALTDPVAKATAIKAANQTYRDALKAARTTRDAAIKAANDTFKANTKIARDTRDTAVKAARDAYKADVAACRAA